ncbi:MAG: metal ABC transporter solute-binding protein, Zn/Mn family [Acidimicrobiales bacterium]
MMTHYTRRLPILLTAVALVLSACGDDTDASAAGEDGRPTIAVTTNILGDVVENIVGDRADVVTVMPVGASPHDFQASARQVNEVREADALIVNGGGFEEGLLDLIESAEADGVVTYEALSAVDTLAFRDHGDEEHGDEEHGDEEHGDEGDDPHFFTDPARMVSAAEGIVGFLAENVAGLDDLDSMADAAGYVDELRALDDEIDGTLAAVAPEDRVLVTNHEVFGYFADRYDFEVVGTVIPAGTTSEAASGGALSELAQILRDEGVTAVFADTSSNDRLAETLADEVGDVSVVELFSESLGEGGSEGDSYVAMMRTNAERIVSALS